jgi:hypothetical protein
VGDDGFERVSKVAIGINGYKRDQGIQFFTSDHSGERLRHIGFTLQSVSSDKTDINTTVISKVTKLSGDMRRKTKVRSPDNHSIALATSEEEHPVSLQHFPEFPFWMNSKQ